MGSWLPRAGIDSPQDLARRGRHETVVLLGKTLANFVHCFGDGVGGMVSEIFGDGLGVKFAAGFAGAAGVTIGRAENLVGAGDGGFHGGSVAFWGGNANEEAFPDAEIGGCPRNS